MNNKNQRKKHLTIQLPSNATFTPEEVVELFETISKSQTPIHIKTTERRLPWVHAAIREAFVEKFAEACEPSNGQGGNLKTVETKPGDSIAIIEFLRPEQFARLDTEHPQWAFPNVAQAMKDAGTVRPGRYWATLDTQGRVVLQDEGTLPARYRRDYHREQRKQPNSPLRRRLGWRRSH